MPYRYSKVGNKYIVYNKQTGTRIGSTSGTKTALNKYLAALHTNVNESTQVQKLRECIRKEISKALKECTEEPNQATDIGNMKISVQLVDIYFVLKQDPKRNIYAYPSDQTRLVKAFSRYGFTTTVEPLLGKINTVYGKDGIYNLAQKETDPGKPLVFLYTPKR